MNAVASDEYYNLTDGGSGNSVRGCVYITNGVINKKVMPDELEYYYSIGFYKGGPTQTQETILKRAKSNTGKKRTKETCLNISNALKGRKLSPEHARKSRLAALGKPSDKKGKIIVNNGSEYIYIYPKELESYIQKGYVKGGKSHKNGDHRKGKIAVNDGNKSIFIFPHELDTYIAKGYLKGAIKRNKVKTS